ncbi:MAG: ABC transporter permease [Planctomycetota bacterium]
MSGPPDSHEPSHAGTVSPRGAAEADATSVLVLEPRSGWAGLGLRGLWGWRELFFALMWRDIRSRYRQAVLGVLWALIRPLATMLVFAFVLGRLARVDSDGQPYALFSYTGLLAWGLFGSSVQSASQSVLAASGFVTKVYFPRILLPLSSIGAAALDFLVALALLPPLLLYYDVPLRSALLLAPLIVVWIAVAAAGVGVLVAGVVVRHRDFGHATTFLLQLWMYVTPVLYPTSLLPEHLRLWAYLNPMAAPVELFRATVLDTPVSAAGCAMSAAATAVFLVVGLTVFARVERHFADVI